MRLTAILALFASLTASCHGAGLRASSEQRDLSIDTVGSLMNANDPLLKEMIDFFGIRNCRRIPSDFDKAAVECSNFQNRAELVSRWEGPRLVPFRFRFCDTFGGNPGCKNFNIRRNADIQTVIAEVFPSDTRRKTEYYAVVAEMLVFFNGRCTYQTAGQMTVVLCDQGRETARFTSRNGKNPVPVRIRRCSGNQCTNYDLDQNTDLRAVLNRSFPRSTRGSDSFMTIVRRMVFEFDGKCTVSSRGGADGTVVLCENKRQNARLMADNASSPVPVRLRFCQQNQNGRERCDIYPISGQTNIEALLNRLFA